MTTLRVLPNPFHAFDKEGVPCAVVPRDPAADGGVGGQYVGARVDPNATKVFEKLPKGDELRKPRQRIRYSYCGIAAADPELIEKLVASEPIELPVSPYYKRQIADGALIAADPATAKSAGVLFHPPAVVLCRSALPAAPPAEPEPELELDEAT